MSLTPVYQVARALGLLVAIGVLCVLSYVALLVAWSIARDYPWAALAALPMIAAYAWAIWAHSPEWYFRFGVALGVQVVTLSIAQLVSHG